MFLPGVVPQEAWEGSPSGCRPSQPWALLVKQGEHIAPICSSHLIAWYLCLTGCEEELSHFDICAYYPMSSVSVYWRCKCDSTHCSLGALACFISLRLVCLNYH